jgi:hypothetical protein
MLENTEGAVKMDNPDKLATQGTQHEDEQQKKKKKEENPTQYVLDITIRKQT